MICLDTTFLIDLLDTDRAGHEAARRWLAANRDLPLHASSFTLWEVLRGIGRLDGPAAVEPLATELDWVTPLPLTSETVIDAALIEAELREDGNEISSTDYPIAGTAREAGATLVTADSDFEKVRGLAVDRYDRAT